ncbi:hypothetical protein [Caulobacter hibisci]|uniref:Antifreeze protein n=1 Tax=Caulobacter hibisci TaxID=2035993 RepID=A0ABS0T3M6_9CAUL|nr:hypothetical protein [Caulobacter hibisci]MBI1685483.1 hypothetical protein [Caulobacter hibisci]
MARRKDDWSSTMLDAWALGMEASAVIGLRTMVLAGGGAKAQTEAVRMTTEKMAAAADIGLKFWTGGLPQAPEAATAAVVKHYRAKVRANRRRLGRGG